MFWPFGKNKTKKIKEDSEMTEDEKQIAEAKKDISKKGPDSQTEKDRVDESVGEQEKLDGNKDSQTAKDRVDESEGAKKADEKDDRPKWAAEMSEAMNKLVSMFEKFTADMADHHDAEEKHMAEEEKLGESSKKYATGLAAGYAGGGEKKYSIADVEKLLKSTR